ncbi:ExbD/TolR family protein [Helicobacter kayseriensis]|uniref:ExbD/TolR family protein n=1 Tax=Helicobacter kayseriensis TaxID=2905877 RepID=UPI001E39FE2A|nr:biopolymer transporter ExbD [Helicobacter kayseriensis]MCE3047462.1 biopolymer transporter ExbD [Helicobacter kayseriensis]MCE3048805.1 biopolymer transporter ExbD [Helicobacter kayseriensis]
MKKMDSMNLVPFIDIMLVLLVIVLTSATFINTSKVPIDIPQSQEEGQGNKEIDQKEVIVSIDKNGKFFLGDELVSFSTLSARIASMDKKTHIILKGDRKSQFDAFVQVMQMFQKNKMNNVYILVQEK